MRFNKSRELTSSNRSKRRYILCYGICLAVLCETKRASSTKVPDLRENSLSTHVRTCCEVRWVFSRYARRVCSLPPLLLFLFSWHSWHWRHPAKWRRSDVTTGDFNPPRWATRVTAKGWRWLASTTATILTPFTMSISSSLLLLLYYHH